ncbi:MAG: hypothetical protein LC624_10870 [Halobacteriales archaeon]|nr:hypothetical protein [Halobacteriales archaeon]
MQGVPAAFLLLGAMTVTLGAGLGAIARGEALLAFLLMLAGAGALLAGWGLSQARSWARPLALGACGLAPLPLFALAGMPELGALGAGPLLLLVAAPRLTASPAP